MQNEVKHIRNLLIKNDMSSQTLLRVFQQRMQEELKAVINRFQDNEYYKLSNLRESTIFRYRSQYDHHFLKQEISDLNDRIKTMQNIIESLITDGNKMHRIYEEMIQEMSMNTDAIAQELAQAKRALQEQKIQSEKIICEWGERMDSLKRQIQIKEDNFRGIQQKYQELQENLHEKVIIDTLQVKEIESELLKESRHHQETILLTQREIGQTKRNLTQAIQEIQRLQNQNWNLKNENQRIIDEYQALLQRIQDDPTGNFIRIDDRQDQEYYQGEQRRSEVESMKMQSLHIENFNMESNNQEEYKVIVEQLYTDRVPQPLSLNAGKEMLHISENHFRYNNPSILGSKLRDSMENVNDYKRKFNLTTNRTLAIDIVGETTRNKSITQNIIEHSIRFQTENPYLAFFRLLVQCEKMNSAHFDKISHINISHLYEELKSKKIPYNKWQEEIKKVLDGKVKAKVVQQVRGVQQVKGSKEVKSVKGVKGRR